MHPKKDQEFDSWDNNNISFFDPFQHPRFMRRVVMFCRTCHKKISDNTIGLNCYSCQQKLFEISKALRKSNSEKKVGSSVYAISAIDSDTADIKFGFSEFPIWRLKSLQTGSPVELVILAECRASQHYERKIHRHLKKYRRKGEWFQRNEFSLEILERIKANTLVEFFAELNLPKP